jgi:hypothetical protein
MSLTGYVEVNLISGPCYNLDKLCYFGLNKNNNQELNKNNNQELDKFMVNIHSDSYLRFLFWYEMRKMHNNTTKTFVREDTINYGKEHTLYYYSISNEIFLPIIWDGSRYGEGLKMLFFK